MSKSPYSGKSESNYIGVTDRLIEEHPLDVKEIVSTVLRAWDDIFNSKIGSFSIGKDIFPSPQIMSFLLHELIAHYIELNSKGKFKVGKEKNEKDVHCTVDSKWSIEIKASSNARQIFANRSYAQPQSGNQTKSKDGYYITINFEKFLKDSKQLPKITLIRFGYLEHKDWIAQSAATGQQARLSNQAYQYKLKEVYSIPLK